MTRRTELKQFLRERREAMLAPTTRGARRRRTPGLRREELGVLAGGTVTWYTWLEQGRDIRCSPAVLERLSRALQLSDSDYSYLCRLAGHAPRDRPRSVALDPGVQPVLDAYQAGPALLMGPRLDVLAFNAFANAIFRIDAAPEGTLERNYVWRSFMDPEIQRTYIDWEPLMVQAVARLRANYASRIGDPDFESFIEALNTASPEFRALWSKQRTLPLRSVTVRLRTEEFGAMNFLSTRFVLPEVADHVAFFQVPVDARTRRVVTAWYAKQKRRSAARRR